jgi:5'-nucleotidase
MEGYLLGIPAIAISLNDRSGEHFATAAQVARDLVRRFTERPVREPMLLNVNIPHVPISGLRGIEVTRLGKRHKAEPVIKTTTPRNEVVYWIGAAGGASDAGPGTDFHAVAANRVSVTPLRIDLTHDRQLNGLREWLDS